MQRSEVMCLDSGPVLSLVVRFPERGAVPGSPPDLSRRWSSERDTEECKT